MREVTIPVTFKIGTIQEIGMGGFKAGWFDTTAEDGTELSLTAGAGLGNPLLEAWAERGGQHVYANTDMRKVAEALFDELRKELDSWQIHAASAGLASGGETSSPRTTPEGASSEA